MTDSGSLLADSSFTISVKGTNDDPIVNIDNITVLAPVNEDAKKFISVEQLLQGYDDVDGSDLLTVEGINVYKADANGQALPDIAGFITSRLANNDVGFENGTSGYEFTPLDDLVVMLSSAIQSQMVTDLVSPLILH